MFNEKAMKKKLFSQTECGAPVSHLLLHQGQVCKSNVMKSVLPAHQPENHVLAFFFLVPVFSQMYLVIFPEGTRYNPELKSVIAESQAFAAKEGTPEAAGPCCRSSLAY